MIIQPVLTVYNQAYIITLSSTELSISVTLNCSCKYTTSYRAAIVNLYVSHLAVRLLIIEYSSVM